MTPDVIPPDTPSAFAQFGEIIISLALSAIGGVMWFFTRRHIDSMDKLAEKLGGLAEDVSGMRADIAAIRASQDKLESRVSRIEASHMDDDR